MKNFLNSLMIAAMASTLVLATFLPGTRPAEAASTTIVISQVYSGGGNSGATYKNDFIELFNLGSSPVDLAGWSVQYASSSGSTWTPTSLSGTIQPKKYYLIKQAAGTGGTVDLPAPDATGSVAMNATAGKVALVNNTTALTGACPGGWIDFVGYGTANCSETAPTAALSNTTAALRKNGGAVDTDNNGSDFDIAAPNPRNSAWTDTAPSVSSTVPANGAIDFQVSENLTVTFSEPVDVTGDWFTITCTGSGSMAAVASGGPTIFALDPIINFTTGDTCTLTILAANVKDQDISDPPDDMTSNYTASFTTKNVCAQTFTSIPQIQGSGAAVAIFGSVTTQGVVVGDYEGAAPALRGFFIQDPTGDGNLATSDGIFVFDPSNSNTVSLGDLVRVTGTAGENEQQSQVTASTITKCGTGTIAPADVTFPVSSADYLERYEGMLVRLPQTMYVTEHYQLGRFGQVVLSSGGRLQQPTNVAAPGAPALALQAANNLNKIILDDAQNSQNPDPILFARSGLPLSASNTLRGGDTATGIVGVLNYTWAGNSASGYAYRIRPVNALGGTVNFEPANPRPNAVPASGGTLTVVGMNTLNYFNTFADDNPGTPGCFPSGNESDCRGANSQAEFDRQWPKTVEAIAKMNPDVLGVNEIENDGYSPTSAIATLVDQLNLVSGPGTYAFIDVDAGTGQTNALGSDAIKIGLIYKPATVTPVGTTAVLNTAAFVNGGDSSARNRPALAQAFEEKSSGERFIVSINHLKSKGSACTIPDAGDGQGNCNVVRTNAAIALAQWLVGDPTGTGDPDILLIGDYNSYAMEDPITALKNAGYTNLIDKFVGAEAYSYVFDGQWGYLDHALGSTMMSLQVTGVVEYHINADEPSVLDYNTEFKSAGQITSLYAPDEFRTSDHDPVIIRLWLREIPKVYLPLISR